MYSVAGSIFPAARAMLNGLMMTFYSIGAYVGPTYYGWSLERTGDWSIGLTHMGFVTVIFGLLLILGFKKKYTDTSTAIKRIHLVEAVRTVGFNKVVWLGVLIQILNIIPYWGFASMGPYLFMTYKGFSPTEAGSFFGAIYGIGGLSGVILGFFADRFGRKPTIIFLSGLNALCAFLISMSSRRHPSSSTLSADSWALVSMPSMCLATRLPKMVSARARLVWLPALSAHRVISSRFSPARSWAF